MKVRQSFASPGSGSGAEVQEIVGSFLHRSIGAWHGDLASWLVQTPALSAANPHVPFLMGRGMCRQDPAATHPRDLRTAEYGATFAAQTVSPPQSSPVPV